MMQKEHYKTPRPNLSTPPGSAPFLPLPPSPNRKRSASRRMSITSAPLAWVHPVAAGAYRASRRAAALPPTSPVRANRPSRQPERPCASRATGAGRGISPPRSNACKRCQPSPIDRSARRACPLKSTPYGKRRDPGVTARSRPSGRHLCQAIRADLRLGDLFAGPFRVKPIRKHLTPAFVHAASYPRF
jgi:hypothetical protein